MASPDLSRIRLLILDVDGVLTDGRIGLTAQGDEIKFFFIQDGLAIRMAQRCGIQVAFLSGRRSQAVLQRARELEVSTVIEGSRDKLHDLQTILTESGVTEEQTAAMGDDLPDLPLLQRVQFSAAPCDAAPEVLSAVDYACEKGGGRGAVREVIERILKQRAEWPPE